MKAGTRWVIIDTETDGLYDPIHVVELSAQIMDGWDPIGEPFRMLLNHDVPIPPEAVAIHGYTQEFLRAHGEAPERVYEAFREHARDYPLVAHNLSYDWNRCLEPEWARLNIAPIGRRGFCCMMLARRLVAETKSYRLDVLKDQFGVTGHRSHYAKDDVLSVVELFQRVYRPRLESAGVDTFEGIESFAKRTPVAKCLAQVDCGCDQQPRTVEPKDEWHYLDQDTNPRGPFTASAITKALGAGAIYVWREGMKDWLVSSECAEFIALAVGDAQPAASERASTSSKSMMELVGLCRGLIADEKITTAEVHYLNSWLEDAGLIREWPASEIAQMLERILADGKVSKQEKLELKQLLESLTLPAERQGDQDQEDNRIAFDQGTSAALPSDDRPYDLVDLEQGSTDWLEWRRQGIGASDAPVIMGENPWKDVNRLFEEKRSAAVRGDANEAMTRGIQLEPEARKRYEESTGQRVKPACLQHGVYPWLRASVDGISQSGDCVVEIKCGESVYRHASSKRSAPRYYFGQLQHIMAVTGLTSAHFWCYLPGRPEILITVDRDEGYIGRMLEAEHEFWLRLQSTP